MTPKLRQHLAFCLFALLSIPAFWPVLRDWYDLSLRDQRYSHLLVVPILSGWLLFRERRNVFDAGRPGSRRCLVALLIAATLHLLIRHAALGQEYRLPLAVLSMLLVWTSAFARIYGPDALRGARFPALLLLLTVPVPSRAVDWIISILQRGSAEMTQALFRLAAVPLYRDGIRFELPGVWIEVARECSAIHSGVALFITGLLLGHLFLASARAKVCLSLLTIPVAMFTNAVRIVTIWFLGTRVDPGFLYGDLHQRGGILFSLISLSILIAFLLLLRMLGHRQDRQNA